MESVWRKCSSCKKNIEFGAPYYVCSVTTCQSKVTNYVFCGISCWDAHLPTERHRSGTAGAIERTAPATPSADVGQRKVVVTRSVAATLSKEDSVLVVVTKVRKYIHDRAGMNTSASVYEALSAKIRDLCDAAVEQARIDGRKTVMDRDFN